MNIGNVANKTVEWILGIVIVLAIIGGTFTLVLGYMGSIGTSQTYNIVLANGSIVTSTTPSILTTLFSPTTGLGVIIFAIIILIAILGLFFAHKKGK